MFTIVPYLIYFIFAEYYKIDFILTVKKVIKYKLIKAISFKFLFNIKKHNIETFCLFDFY